MVQEVTRHLSVRTATVHNRAGCIVHRWHDEQCFAAGPERASGCRSAVVLNDQGCNVGGERRQNVSKPEGGQGPIERGLSC
jgi:hypothetical protein